MVGVAEQTIPYLVAILAGWVVAHTIKGVIAWLQDRKLNLVQILFLSGGMPSSHTATVVAVWTLIAMSPESSSGLIGLATIFVLIVCYDAVKVRRSVGEQGIALRQLIRNSGQDDIKMPRAAKGHTPLEVAVGGCIGLLIGFVVYSTML